MKVKWSRHLDGFPRRDQPSLSIELDRNPQSLGFTITPESGDQNKNKKPKRGGFLQIFKLTEKKQTPSETDSKLKEETYRKSELTENGHYSDVVVSTFPERDLAATKDESTCGKLITINSNHVQQKAATLPRGTSPNIISQMKHLDNLKRRSTASVTSDPGDMIVTVDPEHKKVKYAIGGLVKLKDYFSDSTCDPKNYKKFEEETLAKTQNLDMLRKDKDDTRKKTEQPSDSADSLLTTCPRVCDSTKQLVPLNLENNHSWSSTLLNKESCHQRLRNESNKSASLETGSKEKVGVSSLDKEPDRILMPLGKPSALKMNKHTRNTHYVRFADEFLEDSKSCRSSCSVLINDVEINKCNQEQQEQERDKNNEEFQTSTNKHENNPSDVPTKERKVCHCPSMDPYSNSETRRNKNTEEVSYSLLNKPQTNLHFSNIESYRKVELICSNKYLGKQDTTRLEADSKIFQENKETSDELLGFDSQTNKHDRHTKPDIVAYSGSDTTTKYGTSPEKLPSIISSDFLNTSSSSFHEENGVKQNISSGCNHQDKVLLERKIDESFEPSLISTNLDQHFIPTQLAKQFSDVSNVTFSQLEKLMLQWIQQNEKFLLTREKTSVDKGRQTTDHRKNQEYVQEIQRLGALCETRTKELNLLKMQLKHAILGFDSFCVIVKYLTEELANPRIATELKKTKDDLHKIEIQLRCYETQLEHLKKSNAEEIQELTITLTEAHKEKIEMLVLAHQEELRSLKANHEKEVQDLKSIHVQSMKDAQIRNNSSVDSLREQHNRLIKDLERDFVNQLQQTMEDHKKVQASLKQQLKELRKHCKDLQQEKKQMEGTLQQDTSTKLQWVLAQKSTLQKEVDSLRIVLELKTTEMHQLRKENLEMKKELEKLPIAEKKIEILRRRNEDLQALIDEKVRVERQLTSESQQLKEEFEKESKMNSRLSMEKEELQWKLKQTMEASVLLSTMTDSSSNVLDKLLQDDSLLRSPVRMSVYLNEHDTSPSNGERNSFPRPLSTGRLTPNNSSSGEKCHSSASRRSSSKAKVKRSKQLESSSETPNLSHLSNLPTQKENELDYGSYTDNNGVKHVMNSNFLPYDPESHTLDLYELPIDKRISRNNQVLTETASFKECEYEEDHSNQDVGLNHQNVSSSSQKTLDDVPNQDSVIKQTDNEEDGLTDSQGSFLQESTQTENLCPESMTSSSCSWSSAADNGQVKEMWMAISSADLAFSEQSSDGNETNQYKTSDLEHIQRRAGYQTGKCSPRYFAGEAMSQVKSIGSVCHKTTSVENLDGNLKHTTNTTSK